MHTILTILWRDDRDYGVHYVAKSQLVEKWKTRNRDRGKPRGSSPPTPPYMRVRIRRFRDLSREGRRFVSPFADGSFAAPRFLSGFTLSAPGKLRRSGLAGAWPP